MSEIVNFSRGQGLSWSDVDDKNGKFECVLYGNLYTDYDTIISKIAHKSKIKGSVLSKKFDVLMPASDTTPTGLARALCIINSGISLGGDINILSPIRDNGMCIAYSLNHHKSELIKRIKGTTVRHLQKGDIEDLKIPLPINMEEQAKISKYLYKLDNLITLHQRKFLVSINHKLKGEVFMLNATQNTDLFCEYYAKWIRVYKEGAIRKVTMDKYLMTYEWLKRLIPSLMICEMNRIAYQQLINDYAELHERQTTMDFHHQLKGAILDAVDEGLIEKDPTRKAIIKGKTPRIKKIKYLNQFELHTLLTHLNLGEKINWDWFILLVAKTGMRFSEALALTPKDFDFAHQSLSINKTWNYKEDGGFLPTKNKSSVRKIQIDWQTVIQFSELLKFKPEDEPIFIKMGQKIYNSTVNGILERHCKAIKVPIISIHGLRHTHASLLLFAGVSIASVARRLGHSSMTTTQKTYLHIIHELENQDVDLVMRSLSGLS